MPPNLSAAPRPLYTAMELLVLLEVEAQVVEVMAEEGVGVEVDCTNMRVNSQLRVCIQCSKQSGDFTRMAAFSREQIKSTFTWFPVAELYCSSDFKKVRFTGP